MAKRSRKQSKTAKTAAGPKHMVSHPKFAGRQYDCYGKHVRTGRGTKKSPRVYCGRRA